jgi:hypothetical protein
VDFLRTICLGFEGDGAANADTGFIFRHVSSQCAAISVVILEILGFVKKSPGAKVGFLVLKPNGGRLEHIINSCHVSRGIAWCFRLSIYKSARARGRR